MYFRDYLRAEKYVNKYNIVVLIVRTGSFFFFLSIQITKIQPIEWFGGVS